MTLSGRGRVKPLSAHSRQFARGCAQRKNGRTCRLVVFAELRKRPDDRTTGTVRQHDLGESPSRIDFECQETTRAHTWCRCTQLNGTEALQTNGAAAVSPMACGFRDLVGDSHAFHGGMSLVAAYRGPGSYCRGAYPSLPCRQRLVPFPTYRRCRHIVVFEAILEVVDRLKNTEQDWRTDVGRNRSRIVTDPVSHECRNMNEL